MRALAKYYPVDWSVPKNLGDSVNEFIVEHQPCFEKCADMGMGTGMFAFRTEMDDDGLMSDYSERPHKVAPQEKP